MDVRKLLGLSKRQLPAVPSAADEAYSWSGSVSKDQSTTIEYFIPTFGPDVAPYIQGGRKQGIHHVGRYQWATLALQSRPTTMLIDVACGAGYGSQMIAKAFPTTRVLGVDYDERAIEYARANYHGDNLHYVVGDMTTWRSEGEPMPRCDVIVSFDTIEHLLHREIALMRIADNLADDGWLLFSTPCGHNESRLNPGWEHHKLEYSYSDLFAILSRFFGRVVQPQEDDFPAAEFWRDVINAGTVRYLNRMNPVVCKHPIRTPHYRPLI